MPLRILRSRIDPVTPAEALARIHEFVLSGTPHHVITGNTLMCLEAEHDLELRRIMEEAAMVTPESSGIRWAARVLGTPIGDIVPGIDLMMHVCALAARENWPVFLLGAARGVAEAAAATLRANNPGLQVAGADHGYFSPAEEAGVLDRIRLAGPAVLFVGMGMPGQEKWIARHLQSLGVPVVMGVGGSFDVLCGRLRRAPAGIRRLGMEWLYRWSQEPWRWRRIAQLPLFAVKIVIQKFRWR